jgi:hypothetical protein
MLFEHAFKLTEWSNMVGAGGCQVEDGEMADDFARLG